MSTQLTIDSPPLTPSPGTPGEGRVRALSDGPSWTPIEKLTDRFKGNISALQQRDARLAQQLLTFKPSRPHAIDLTTLKLGQYTPTHVTPLPIALPPNVAKKIATEMTPGNKCQIPLLVVGLDQGWLEDLLYKTPCANPLLPGHRPPLYFACRDLERLWAVLHLHDWQKMLADARTMWFVGPDAIAQIEHSVRHSKCSPWPQMAITVDRSLWTPSHANLDSILKPAQESLDQRTTRVEHALNSTYAARTLDQIRTQFAAGQKLKILGITSRFTTFLQHSMRDWLSGMRKLGHETRLVIESADHELFGPLHYAEACAEFKPDLLLMIDHFRHELRLLPAMLPCVMWVQDRLPNIYTPTAGENQQSLDYCLGHGRLECVEQFNYPKDRFMPAVVGINDSRFAPRKLTSTEKDRFSCDVSFVSHAGAPAETILAEEITKCPDLLGKKLLADVFERLRALYDSGQCLTQPPMMRAILEQSMQSLSISLSNPESLLDFFMTRINNALFRHQSLTWASELGINLHLYGNGWDTHPTFSRYARGVAENQDQLLSIYLATKINLQIFPHGAIHQRLLDGLASGAFFLLRHCPSDEAEPIYQQIFSWCQSHNITTDDQLRSKAPPEIQSLIAKLQDLFNWDPYRFDSSLIEIMRLADDCQYQRCAASMFPREYPKISFSSRAQLHQRITHYLSHEDERSAIVQAMRPIAVENYSYQNISRRLLAFIADDLNAQRTSHGQDARVTGSATVPRDTGFQPVQSAPPTRDTQSPINPLAKAG